MMLYWVILFLLATSTIGHHYGINYLFLDPEYLGKVNYLSFFILGMAYGGFILTWNITSYILHAHRFPFLATLQRPFGIFFLNNSIIPLSFLVVYCINLWDFQRVQELRSVTQSMLDILGLFLGGSSIILIALIYFFRTNKDIWQVLGLKPEEKEEQYSMRGDDALSERSYAFAWRVDNYLNAFLRPRIVRPTTHYDRDLILKVYRQHHGNAVFLELFGLALLAALGLLIDYRLFRIPAGASILILFGLLLSLTGAFSYWVRGWRPLMYIVLFAGLNFLMRYDMFNHRNKAYGLDYEKEAVPYTLDNLEKLSHPDTLLADKLHWEQMLDNWLAKNQKYGEKPKLVLLNASGGGSRSALFSTAILQEAHSKNPEFLDQVFLMAGASGGMLGQAFVRELYLQQKQDASQDLLAQKHLNAISADLLNPICFTIVVNDLFIPWQKFKVDDRVYRKDRAYAFEQQFHANTGAILDKSIGDYYQAEFDQEIPAMIFSPVIINDDRRCFISPQPVSWLCRPQNVDSALGLSMVDGIDFGRFFKDHDAQRLKVSSALRMNATFPYILPNVTLPADPVLELMDAGLRDNFGIESSVRFIHQFQDWLTANTSGVVLVEMRGHEQVEPIRQSSGQSLVDKLTNPISNIYTNWLEVQDYQHDFLLDYASGWLNGNLDVVVFEYAPSDLTEKASMSMHLTRREREHIIAASSDSLNLSRFRDLEKALSITAPPITENRY